MHWRRGHNVICLLYINAYFLPFSFSYILTWKQYILMLVIIFLTLNLLRLPISNEMSSNTSNWCKFDIDEQHWYYVISFSTCFYIIVYWFIWANFLILLLFFSFFPNVFYLLYSQAFLGCLFYFGVQNSLQLWLSVHEQVKQAISHKNEIWRKNWKLRRNFNIRYGWSCGRNGQHTNLNRKKPRW